MHRVFRQLIAYRTLNTTHPTMRREWQYEPVADQRQCGLPLLSLIGWRRTVLIIFATLSGIGMYALVFWAFLF